MSGYCGKSCGNGLNAAQDLGVDYRGKSPGTIGVANDG